ncbi:hypothetical protein D918_01414 [Trichuris suis]|nr:hypothetical protein D918_01414 [Trichuris suis]
MHCLSTWPDQLLALGAYHNRRACTITICLATLFDVAAPRHDSRRTSPSTGREVTLEVLTIRWHDMKLLILSIHEYRFTKQTSFLFVSSSLGLLPVAPRQLADNLSRPSTIASVSTIFDCHLHSGSGERTTPP